MAEDTPSRREADRLLVEIDRKVSRIPETVRAILRSGDFELPGGLTPHALLAEHAEFDATTNRIIAALDGPQVTQTDGSKIRLTEQGLVHQTRENGARLEKIEKTLANGIRTRWPVEVKVAVIAASATVIAALGPAAWETLTRG